MRNRINKMAVVLMTIATVLVGCGTDVQPTTAPVDNGIHKAEQEDVSKNIDHVRRAKATKKDVRVEAPVTEVPVEEDEILATPGDKEVLEDEGDEEPQDTIKVKGIEAVAMYAVSTANVRELPGTDKAVIGSLTKGQEVIVNGVSDDWYKVVIDESLEGYVHNSLLQTEKPAENTAAVVAEEQTNELCVGFAKEVFDATNAERVAAGLPELIWSDELARAADIRAEEIVDDAHFSHVRPDGTKCYALSDRIHGENIGKGPHASGAEFVQHWMESEGHKWNILCDKYTMMGVGTRCTERGDTGVQIFGY